MSMTLLSSQIFVEVFQVKLPIKFSQGSAGIRALS